MKSFKSLREADMSTDTVETNDVPEDPLSYVEIKPKKTKIVKEDLNNDVKLQPYIDMVDENKLADLMKTAFTVLQSCSHCVSTFILFDLTCFVVIITFNNGKSAALPPYAVFLSINQNISNADSPNVFLSFMPKSE